MPPYAHAVVANSGNANACTGERGLQDAREMAAHAAQLLNVSPQDVLPSSTGVIGVFLPMKLVKEGIDLATQRLDDDGGIDMAQAIRTTDTVSKFTGRKVTTDEGEFTIGGIAKGAGMIHPNMATMLVYITTDAKVDSASLNTMLTTAVNQSFNRFTIDGDTSCDDTVLLMANGLSNVDIASSPTLTQAFQEALNDLCLELTYQLARDGEGVTKVATIHVTNTPTKEDAATIARAIAISPLVKTALYGEDPNWGRIINAAGYSGVVFDPTKVSLKIGEVMVMQDGMRTDYKEEAAHNEMKEPEIEITLNLNQGNESDFYITTDFTNAYVDINADYRNRT
jgi:glutamate N-acetyltransferase/amino-acid N-acetyltransferase